jgi:two-component system copper resistance phosphate regulon response regulator CusR
MSDISSGERRPSAGNSAASGNMEAELMRILIVEDEQKVASFLRRALEEEGQAVDVEHDGEAGLQRALTYDYDLVVLDWLLPLRSGLDVCIAIREARTGTPILMLTARDAVKDRIAGLDAGADDYLVKPFALGELLARVRALLRRGKTGAPKLVVGDLTLDPARHRVTRAGQEITLTAKEYALLDYLMRHAGQSLSRTMIAEHVWDFDFDGGTNVVDVYINYLRNKIDRGQERKLIHTMRGVGYCLESRNALSE